MLRKAVFLIVPALLIGILAFTLQARVSPSEEGSPNTKKPAGTSRLQDEFLDNPPLVFDTAPIKPIPVSFIVDTGKAALGKKLFHEPRLSRNQKTSCASCHDLSTAGTDGKPFSTKFDGAQAAMNTPSIFNVSLYPYLYWDGSAKSLEAQAASELEQHMGIQWGTVILLLRTEQEYVRDFSAVYEEGVTATSITNAIAEFERTLLTPNSRFDRYLRGDESAISAKEKKGYILFAKHGCINCHQGVSLGGNMFEKLGAVYPPHDSPWRKDPSLVPKSAMGRFNVTGQEKHRYYYRVPSLRNVAKTAPYFHDGSIDDLEDAIRIMAYYNLGAQLPETDVQGIRSFLMTLTGDYKP